MEKKFSVKNFPKNLGIFREVTFPENSVKGCTIRYW